MLEAGRRRVTFAEMTSTSERALAAAQLRRSKIALPLAPIVSSPARFDLRQSSVRRPRQLLPPASLLLPPAPPPTRLSLLLSLSVLRKHLRCCRAAPIACCRHPDTCVARAHACVRWCVSRAWRTLSNALERPCRRCASRHCRLDGHCLAQNAITPKTRQRRTAHARRAALTVTRPCQLRSSSHASCAAPCPPDRSRRRGQEERDDEGRHLN